MNYFLIAGEASGDMHAASLVSAIRARDPEARFSGLGGDLMREQGVVLHQDYRKMAYMGIVAVLWHWKDIRRNFQIAKETLLKDKPDALILVDYPSFNLKIASFCRKHLPQTRIYYYIPPKVWAWKKWRVHKMAKLCDEILGIFPFEPAFYAQYGYKCRYVGNPTLDRVNAFMQTGKTFRQAADRKYIAVLPGSRRSEITHCLPKMLSSAEKCLRQTGLEADIIIAGAPGIEPDFYQPFQGAYPVCFGQAYELLSGAQAAIINSGTATLEAALLDCLQVPVYHLACGWIAHLRPVLFDSPYFTLPNILLQREVVREKIAYRFTIEQVSDELTQLLTDQAYALRQHADYAEIRQILSTSQDTASATCQNTASAHAADIITTNRSYSFTI